MKNGAGAVVAAFVTLMLPLPAFAQQAGVKAGANFASLTPEEDESPDISRRVGLVAGGWVRVPATPWLMMQLEGLFSEKGVKFDATALGLDSSAELRVRYLEFPVLARVNVAGSGPATRVFVLGGAAPAFMIGSHATATFQGETQSRDVTDEVESFDVGLVGGGGVEFGRAHVEARYTHGLRRINKDHNDPNDNVQNRVFSVAFGFRLF